VRIAGDGGLILAATDLSNLLSCRYRTALEMAEAHGKHRRPRWHDPLLEILFQRGLDHEKTYVDSLRAEGLGVFSLADVREADVAVARTLELMLSGAAVIVQAALADGRWYRRPDVMRRVEKPSGLGEWSYEVTDAKLARETRAGTILQLGLYSEMLGAAQGLRPEYFYVVTPDSHGLAADGPGRCARLVEDLFGWATKQMRRYSGRLELDRLGGSGSVGLGGGRVVRKSIEAPARQSNLVVHLVLPHYGLQNHGDGRDPVGHSLNRLHRRHAQGPMVGA
jgi:hypothetical protein